MMIKAYWFIILSFGIANQTVAQDQDSLKLIIEQLIQPSPQDTLNLEQLYKRLLGSRSKEGIYSLVGKTIPAFTLENLKGKVITTSDLRGKPSIINFWFTNCSPCLAEIPLLNELRNQFKDTVNFIALTFQDKKEVNEFLELNRFEFVHLVSAKDYIKALDFIGYPKTLIVDKNLIIKQVVGMLPQSKTTSNDTKENWKSKIAAQLSSLLLKKF